MKRNILLFVLLFTCLIGSVTANEITIKIDRIYEGEECTVGKMYVNGAPVSMTMEHPYRNNQKDISCVKPGSYKCFIRKKPKGWRVELQDVPDRTFVQIHKGRDLSDSTGCILVAEKIDHRTGLISGTTEAFKALEDSFKANGKDPSISSFEVNIIITGK